MNLACVRKMSFESLTRQVLLHTNDTISRSWAFCINAIPWCGLNDIKMITCFGDISGFDCFMPCTTYLNYELTNKSVLVPSFRVDRPTPSSDTKLM